MQVEALFAFMFERYLIYRKRQAGEPKPWTADPILQRYKFTNVYREHDTVSKWISVNWRGPNQDDPDLWFAMTVARLINWPDTLQELGYPSGWDESYFISTIERRQRRGEKTFGGAYIVSTNGNKMQKAPYLGMRVLTPLWEAREKLRPTKKSTLDSTHAALMAFDGLGSFLAAQVVADLKYVKPLWDAPDWWTWAASGPGSRRGLNRVLGRPVNNPWREQDWRVKLLELHAAIDPYVRGAGMPDIHAQDLQNVLCESDKYQRTLLGEGRPRATYDGGAGLL